MSLILKTLRKLNWIMINKKLLKKNRQKLHPIVMDGNEKVPDRVQRANVPVRDRCL